MEKRSFQFCQLTRGVQERADWKNYFMNTCRVYCMLVLPFGLFSNNSRIHPHSYIVARSCMAVVVWLWTLAALQCRDEARRVSGCFLALPVKSTGREVPDSSPCTCASVFFWLYEGQGRKRASGILCRHDRDVPVFGCMVCFEKAQMIRRHAFTFKSKLPRRLQRWESKPRSPDSARYFFCVSRADATIASTTIRRSNLTIWCADLF